MESRKTVLICLAALIAVASAKSIMPTMDAPADSSEESNELLDELTSEMRGLCRNRTGSDDAYERTVASMLQAITCVSSTLDLVGIVEEVDTLSSTTRVQFFSKYCPQARSAINCLTPVANNVRKCLEQDELEVFDIVVEMIPEALNLLCKNDGEILFMDNANYDVCIDKMTSYVETCVEKISNATDTMDVANYGPVQCAEINDAHQCLKSKLAECQAPRLIDIFDVFYRPAVKKSPCKDYIQLDEPQIQLEITATFIDSNDV